MTTADNAPQTSDVARDQPDEHPNWLRLFAILAVVTVAEVATIFWFIGTLSDLLWTISMLLFCGAPMWLLGIMRLTSWRRAPTMAAQNLADPRSILGTPAFNSAFLIALMIPIAPFVLFVIDLFEGFDPFAGYKTISFAYLAYLIPILGKMLIIAFVIVLAFALPASLTGAMLRRSKCLTSTKRLFFSSLIVVIPAFPLIWTARHSLRFISDFDTETFLVFLLTILAIPPIISLLTLFSREKPTVKSQAYATVGTLYFGQFWLIFVVMIGVPLARGIS